MTDSNREAALKLARDKRDAYVKLFGEPGKPTPYGKVVLDDLDAFCTTWRESVHMTQDGAMCPFTTIYRDGKKAVAQRIHYWLRWRENDDNSDRDSDRRSETGGGAEPISYE